jgi:hypothetical protein
MLLYRGKGKRPIAWVTFFRNIISHAVSKMYRKFPRQFQVSTEAESENYLGKGRVSKSQKLTSNTQATTVNARRSFRNLLAIVTTSLNKLNLGHSYVTMLKFIRLPSLLKYECNHIKLA